MIETDAERAAMLDPAAFGSAAIYQTVGGAKASLNGIFDNPHTSVAVGQGGPTASDRIVSFLARESDLPGGALGGDVGDTLKIGTATYRVVDLAPDGAGLVRIVLGAS